MSRAYVDHLIDLVSREKKVALDSDRKVLLGHLQDLARKGIALLNLRESENERTFKFKRWNIELASLGNELPRHKIVPGDTVQIRGYGATFDPYDEEDIGIVSEVTSEFILISTNKELSITSPCNMWVTNYYFKKKYLFTCGTPYYHLDSNLYDLKLARSLFGKD